MVPLRRSPILRAYPHPPLRVNSRAVPPLPVKGLNFLVLRFRVAAGRFRKSKTSQTASHPVSRAHADYDCLALAREVGVEQLRPSG
jgi:hypothetical protein